MSRFALVMPAFNAATCIHRALKSVAEQTWPVDEVIIVDDGSTDDTCSVVRLWQNRLPIVLIRNKINQGIGASLRSGVSRARCNWVLRLDADDIWLPHHVAGFVPLCQTERAVLLTAPAKLVAGGHPCGQTRTLSDAHVRAWLMWDNPIVHSASGFSRAAYIDVGGYREGVRWEDYDLWIRLLAQGRLASVVQPTIEYTVSPTSLSRTKYAVAIADRWSCQRQALKLFWRRHPIAAVQAITLSAFRFGLAKLA